MLYEGTGKKLDYSLKIGLNPYSNGICSMSDAKKLMDEKKALS